MDYFVPGNAVPGNAVPTVKITLGTPFPGVPAGNNPCITVFPAPFEDIFVPAIFLLALAVDQAVVLYCLGRYKNELII